MNGGKRRSGRLPFSNDFPIILGCSEEIGRKQMQATRAEQRSGVREIFDSPLFWMTILIYAVAFCAYLWSDFLRVFSWIGQ